MPAPSGPTANHSNRGQSRIRLELEKSCGTRPSGRWKSDKASDNRSYHQADDETSDNGNRDGLNVHHGDTTSNRTKRLREQRPQIILRLGLSHGFDLTTWA
jgi:hypothetical protein